MELFLVLALLVIAIVLGITPPIDRGSKVEEDLARVVVRITR